jgi:hypothetical protein
MSSVDDMHNACTGGILEVMPSVTIRDVPAESRNVLAARAARSGQSLQEYLHGALVELASKPDVNELFDEIQERKDAARPDIPIEEILDAIHADRR